MKKRKALTICLDDFRKCLMQTASCIHITLLEESRLHRVRASLSVRKSSPKCTFFLDFWLHTVPGPVYPVQMEVFLTRCVITQGRRAHRKTRLDTQCEQGGVWWGPSCEPPRNPQEAEVKAKQWEDCGAQSLRCSFLWNKSRSWQKRHIAFHCLAWIEERGRSELGKETQEENLRARKPGLRDSGSGSFQWRLAISYWVRRAGST